MSDKKALVLIEVIALSRIAIIEQMNPNFSVSTTYNARHVNCM